MTLANEHGWSKLCRKEASDNTYEKIKKCESDEIALIKDKIKPCVSAERKQPLLCSYYSPFEPQVMNSSFKVI